MAAFVPAAQRPCVCGRAVPTRHYDAGRVAGVVFRRWRCDLCAEENGWQKIEATPEAQGRLEFAAPTTKDVAEASSMEHPCAKCGRETTNEAATCGECDAAGG